MDLTSAVAALKAQFKAGWTHADVPCAFPNESFDKPLDAQQQPLPFLVMRVDWNGSDTNTIGSPGSNRMRRHGILWFDVFVPLNSSDQELTTLMSDAASIFEHQDVPPVLCLEADPGGKPELEDGNYSGESISIAFTYDETA